MNTSLIVFLDYFGIAVFAITGALTAGNKKMDIFGVIVVALITALGGGTLRDLMLDAHPLIWIDNPLYLLVGMLAALATFVGARLFAMPLRTLEICDAIGLAFFTLAGLYKTLSLGHSAVIALLMGMITGVAGGIIRDIICNEIPLIFHREIYASSALFGGAIFLLLKDWNTDVALLMGAFSVLALRLMGIFLGWSMPAFRFKAETD